uniref:17S U2 SnRNP complex component HTATSF1 n=1 Tax=Petromyzon marinus TaxID=7757 RepID=A0AAJ7UHU7_PETMA|nr:HIV Tat-specific factor 1 [Petromyzon marinus]
MDDRRVNAEFYEQLQLLQQQQQQQQEEAGEQAGPLIRVDPTDGAEYEWDSQRQAWFPRVTDDLILAFQTNYGNFTPTAAAGEGPSGVSAGVGPGGRGAGPGKEGEGTRGRGVGPRGRGVGPAGRGAGPVGRGAGPKGEKRKGSEAGWFDIEQEKNTNVYVSGLPTDITQEEFEELMSKCGIVVRDPATGNLKCKLYRDSVTDTLKGDGICCYLKRESVELAMRLLDESSLRGCTVKVEAARFALKGDYDASKRRKRSKEERKLLQQQKKQLDWKPERTPGSLRLKHERVVIIHHLFHPSDFQEDPLVLNEISHDLRSESEKFGCVKKVILFDRHPDGVASVSFREAEEADRCVASLHGRWFGGRQLQAETWDGVTDYQVEETSRERDERIKGWEGFLGADGSTNQSRPPEAPATPAANRSEGSPAPPATPAANRSEGSPAPPATPAANRSEGSPAPPATPAANRSEGSPAPPATSAANRSEGSLAEAVGPPANRKADC